MDYLCTSLRVTQLRIGQIILETTRESSAQNASLLRAGDSLTQKAINDDYAAALTPVGSSVMHIPNG
jgi:hypothetical protein